MRIKISSFLIIIFPAIIFYSCLRFQSKNSGLWFYTYTSKGTSNKYNLTPESFLNLQPDGNFTLDFGEFEYGKWKRNNDTLVLNNSAGNTTAFIMQSSVGKDLKIETETGVVCDFEAQPYSSSRNASEPFSLQNNKWRIKAEHKETQEEIKSRLVSHCEFWKQYFTWALDNNISTIDVRSTPTPIKIYGNGFALKEYGDLPATWKNYFYDSVDCKTANNMLQYIFEHNDIAWANTDNKYKMFIGAFEQLTQMLKK